VQVEVFSQNVMMPQLALAEKLTLMMFGKFVRSGKGKATKHSEYEPSGCGRCERSGDFEWMRTWRRRTITRDLRPVVQAFYWRLLRKIASHRHSLPTKLGPLGCSFQFGRTPILFPQLPHLARTTRERKDGTSVSAG
jgi:hypothetical protein